LRDLHARMLAALLDGEGLRGLCELAAEETGGPVAIALPARGLAAVSDDSVALEALTDFAADRLRDDDAPDPDGLELALPVRVGSENVGFVLALSASRNGLPRVAVDREEVMRTTALAVLTEVAVADARDEIAGEVRGTLIEDLRAGRVDAANATRRAARLGCDLGRGAIALVAEVRSSRPRHAAALIGGEYPGAIAEVLEHHDSAPLGAAGGGEAATATRVYAVLPARGGDDAPERTQASARALVARLRPHGPATFSSFCPDPADLDRAISEAELMLEVVARNERMAEQLENGIGDGVYRLLFLAMATDPAEVRRFFEDTVAPLVEHDRQYRTDLLATLESYFSNDCNMNATARAVYAHRHTVAHRLARVRELTGLDPGVGEDRERLGLGIKAYRIISPTLPR
jgi:hypothetical protein